MFILRLHNWPIRTHGRNNYFPSFGSRHQYYPINYGGYNSYPFYDQFAPYSSYSPFNYYSQNYFPQTKAGRVFNLISQFASLPYYYSHGLGFGGYSNYCDSYNYGGSYYPTYDHFDQLYYGVMSNLNYELYANNYYDPISQVNNEMLFQIRNQPPSYDHSDQAFDNANWYLNSQGIDLYGNEFTGNINTAVGLAADYITSSHHRESPQRNYARNLGSG